MNADRMNLRIAVACGWIYYDGWHHESQPHLDGDIPNYCEDLNAMHEAEKSIPADDRWFYVSCLCGCPDGRVTFNDIHSNALKRASAFCWAVRCSKCGKQIVKCEESDCKGGV